MKSLLRTLSNRDMWECILVWVLVGVFVPIAVIINVLVLVVSLPIIVVAFIFAPKKSWHILSQKIGEVKSAWQKRRRECYERAASDFMLFGIQMGWGDPERCVRATTELLRLAKFRAKPAWGNSRGNPFCPCTFLVYEGKDAKEAKAWVENLHETLPRGDFTVEVKAIVEAIIDRR